MAQPGSAAVALHKSKSFYGRTPPPIPKTRTELDVLLERHQFIRDSNETEENLSWEDRLAKKTYDQLFKELAICDLSKYKQGKVAMRWRTAKEVISGKGHLTCSNQACPAHEPRPFTSTPWPPLHGSSASSSSKTRGPDEASSSLRPPHDHQPSFIPLEDSPPRSKQASAASEGVSVHLTELMTNFSYLESGRSPSLQRKVAQVKLNLCDRCLVKMNKSLKLKNRDKDLDRAIQKDPHADAQRHNSDQTTKGPSRHRHTIDDNRGCTRHPPRHVGRPEVVHREEPSTSYCETSMPVKVPLLARCPSIPFVHCT